jgi:hypothetical protein
LIELVRAGSGPAKGRSRLKAVAGVKRTSPRYAAGVKAAMLPGSK